MSSNILTDIQSIQGNNTLWQDTHFASRMQALDHLAFIIDHLDDLLRLRNPPAELLSVKQWALTISQQLEAIDWALFERLRAAIRNGHCQGRALLDLINSYAGQGLSNNQLTNPGVGYDELDVFTNGLLSSQALPSETQKRQAEMIFYQKTPTRIILELVAKANLTKQDVFYDLGSGLGQVCLLVNLLTGTPTKGIEVEPAYCRYAQISAQDLNLPNVVFQCEDARTAHFDDGSVFFLYTPFEGRILQDVLEKLQMIAQHRPIKLFSYGPCTAHIAGQPWLRGGGQLTDYVDQLGEFRSCQPD
ncbi:class I SAM-dependent methyltransferase [Spirosoma radiotolerans]|uniref:hypothetical protein n=1 Tax=Spirosoma radiotolerans TaxID=1379870 RepID=UPI00069743B5|nr:hypothetical protein [Spirosoma radiotolerans]